MAGDFHLGNTYQRSRAGTEVPRCSLVFVTHSGTTAVSYPGRSPITPAAYNLRGHRVIVSMPQPEHLLLSSPALQIEGGLAVSQVDRPFSGRGRGTLGTLSSSSPLSCQSTEGLVDKTLQLKAGPQLP